MFLKLLFAGVASSLLLGGCSLYQPTLPATPLLSKGQVQVTVGTRSLASFEAGAAWAPTRHLLLSAESSLQSGTTSTTDASGQTLTYHDYHRQLSLGAGYYRAPTATSRWYLAALGGVGVARTALRAIDFEVVSPWFPFPLPYVAGQYEASYRRYYVQAYAAQPAGEYFTSGFSLRSTWVDYTHLTYDNQALDPTNHLFFEPTFFLKRGSGPLQLVSTLGCSIPLQTSRGNPLSRRTSPISSLLGLTLIFRPDLLKHQR